jgi:LmbE family N-acetylglucosaminyl deacetylase
MAVSRPVLPVNELPAEVPPTHDLPTPARALAVGAHPDDIEFGCGATLARWAADGCALTHLVLTDGAKGTWDPDTDPATLAAARQAEQREAAGRLGGGAVGFLGRPDGELRNGVQERYEVCRWIRSVRPDVVLGHDPWRRYRLHPDHRNAGFIVTDALVAARDPAFFGDQGLEPWRPEALLLWEADVANHYESATGFAEAKVDALLAHASQHRSSMGVVGAGGELEGHEAFAARVTAQLAAHGAHFGAGPAEAFHLIDEV